MLVASNVLSVKLFLNNTWKEIVNLQDWLAAFHEVRTVCKQTQIWATKLKAMTLCSFVFQLMDSITELNAMYFNAQIVGHPMQRCLSEDPCAKQNYQYNCSVVVVIILNNIFEVLNLSIFHCQFIADTSGDSDRSATKRLVLFQCFRQICFVDIANRIFTNRPKLIEHNSTRPNA